MRKMTQEGELPQGLTYTVKLVAEMIEAWLSKALMGSLWLLAPAQDEAACDLSYMTTRGMGEAILVFMQGIPVGSVLCCTSHLVRAEGRRSVFRGQVQDRPGGKLYATGEAEFVTALAPGVPALQKPLQSRL